MSEAPKSTIVSMRRYRLLLLLGVPPTLTLLILALVAVEIARLPSRGTAGAVAQTSLLLGAFQGFLGLAVMLTTVYYARQTAELVAASRREESDRARQRLDDAVGELVGSAMAVAASAGAVSALMDGLTRWTRRREEATRLRFLEPHLGTVTSNLSEAARASEAVKYLAPELGKSADSVFDRALEAHAAALRAAMNEEHSVAVREAVTRLRTASAVVDLPAPSARSAAVDAAT